MKERLLVVKGTDLSKDKLFELIKDAVDGGQGRMVGYLCRMLKGSRSGYYSYLNSSDARLGWNTSDAKVGELVKKAFN